MWIGESEISLMDGQQSCLLVYVEANGIKGRTKQEHIKAKNSKEINNLSESPPTDCGA